VCAHAHSEQLTRQCSRTHIALRQTSWGRRIRAEAVSPRLLITASAAHEVTCFGELRDSRSPQPPPFGSSSAGASSAMLPNDVFPLNRFFFGSLSSSAEQTQSLPNRAPEARSRSVRVTPEVMSSCGRTCAFVTAGLLVACGIVVLVFALLNLNLPPALLEEACLKTSAGMVRLYLIAPAGWHGSVCTCMLALVDACRLAVCSKSKPLIECTGQVKCADLDENDIAAIDKLFTEVSVPDEASLTSELGKACMVAMKGIQGCKCPSGESEETCQHEDMDCSSTLYGEIVNAWPIAMIVLGAAGLSDSNCHTTSQLRSLQYQQ
jgi:hypothetical protein